MQTSFGVSGSFLAPVALFATVLLALVWRRLRDVADQAGLGVTPATA
jgi:hypothetical protein